MTTQTTMLRASIITESQVDISSQNKMSIWNFVEKLGTVAVQEHQTCLDHGIEVAVKSRSRVARQAKLPFIMTARSIEFGTFPRGLLFSIT